ncbi:MAG: preprotein translocase subunit YajC, partial [Acidimicrobiales bacterium]
MHTHVLTALLVLSKAASTKKVGAGGSSAFIFLILIVVAVYFFFLRPRSRRARQQQQSKSTFQVGDDVISAGGILGRVTNIVGDEIEVEVAPGTTLTFWRRAINLRSTVAGAPQPAADTSPVPGEHYGIEDRYDDETGGDADAVPGDVGDGADDGASYSTEDEDGARYGVEETGAWTTPPGSGPAAAPGEPAAGVTGAPLPPQPYLDPSLGSSGSPEPDGAPPGSGRVAGKEPPPPG